MQGSTYEDFINKVKAKFNKQKQDRKKENLRPITFKKLVESEDESNDEQFLRKSGNKWWGRISRHYFLKIHQDHIDHVRQLTTSQDITQFGAAFSPLLPFFQQIIYVPEDHIFLDDSIRILYRLYDKLTDKQKHILAGYSIKPKTMIQNGWPLPEPCKPLSFYSFHYSISGQNKILSEQQSQKIQNESKSVDLQLIGFTVNETYIYKCLQYENIWRNENTTQIQKQIQCWRIELQNQHKTNKKKWERIQQKWQQQKIQFPEWKGINERIQQLKKQLIHSETFSYFRLGYSDKTPQDLSAAIKYSKQNQNQHQNPHMHQQSKYIRNHNANKKSNNSFFQTDCKVCFCTKNQNSNKVIYCDSCNTSFHQSCYGIESIDEDKDDEFICDVCVYIRKFQNQFKGQKCQLPTCQICGRCKFPIKNLNGHFYHISCLILFNFATIHAFSLSLRPGITYQKIMQEVISNQMDTDYCEYCIKNSYSGMKFKCSYQLCAKSFHPICAYLNGCVFQMKRKSDVGGFSVSVKCREHDCSGGFAQLVSQVYFRRYLCNYRKTVQVKQQDFKKIYEAQVQKIAKSSRVTQFSEGGIRRILNLKKLRQPQRKKLQISKKTQSITSNPSSSKNAKEVHKLKKSISSKEKDKKIEEEFEA